MDGPILDLLRATNIWKKRKLSLTQLSLGGEKNDFGFSVDDGKKIPILYYLSKQ